MPKEVWVKIDSPESWDSRKRYVTSSLESGADAILACEEDIESIRKLGNIKIVSYSEKADILLLKASTPKEVKKRISEAQEEKERETAIMVDVSSKELEEAAVRAGKHADFLIMVAEDWKVIPLENLIAKLQEAKAKILAGVKSSEEAKTAIETLEVGAEGVVLDPLAKGSEEIKQTCETIEKLGTEKFELVPAEVTKIEPSGMGDRVCVDTSSIMTLGEGMLVGSQSTGLLLVHSESLESEYVSSRPFRVNAGAVHAYIQIPDGKTKYLSELKSGDEVLIVNSEGEGKNATIGRAKIERRPMLLVEVVHEGKKIRTLLQNAETINLVGENGDPLSVSELEVGDKVLANFREGGRHFGAKVKETLVER